MTIAAVTVNFQTYSLEYTNETEETMYARAKVLINQLAEKQGAPLAGSFTADITSGVKTTIESDRTPEGEPEMTSTSSVTFYVNMNRPGYLPDDSSNDYPTWQDASEAALDLIDHLDSANDFDYDQDQLIDAQNNNTPMNIEVTMTNIYDAEEVWVVFIAMVDTDNDPKAEEKMMVLESHNLFNGVPGEPRQAPGNAAHLHFDRHYAPCSVLIVRDGADFKDEANTVLIQGDDDMEAVAFYLGHQSSDTSWYDFLRDAEGISAPALLDYFTSDDAYANLPPIGGGSHEAEILDFMLGDKGPGISQETIDAERQADEETITAELIDALRSNDQRKLRRAMDRLTNRFNRANQQRILENAYQYTNLPPMSGGSHEAARGMKQHYHVNAAMPGCLPDNSSIYLTKKDAEAGMQWEKNSWLEAWDGATASGNKRTMYVIDRKLDYGCDIFITLDTCNDPDCDIDAEY